MTRHRDMKIAIYTALCLLFAVACLGEQPRAQLPVDHPELYSSFFFFVEDFSKWLDSRGTKVPANKAKLIQSAARYLKVEPSELPKLIFISGEVAVTLRQISGDGQKYWDDEQKAQRSPDAATVQQFNLKRQNAIQAGIDRLKKELSKVSWEGVYAHINGEHRTKIQLLPATATPPGLSQP